MALQGATEFSTAMEVPVATEVPVAAMETTTGIAKGTARETISATKMATGTLELVRMQRELCESLS